jgi:hypothetical protein
MSSQMVTTLLLNVTRLKSELDTDKSSTDVTYVVEHKERSACRNALVPAPIALVC